MLHLLIHRKTTSMLSKSLLMINEIRSSMHPNEIKNLNFASNNRIQISLINIQKKLFSKDTSVQKKISSRLTIQAKTNDLMRKKTIVKASNKSIFKFLYPYYCSPKIAKLFSLSLILTIISKIFSTSVNITNII